MMWRYQNIGLQVGKTLEQGQLHRTLNITWQQDRHLASINTQHTGAFVATVVAIVRMQYLKLNAINGPLLSRAAPGSHRSGKQLRIRTSIKRLRKSRRDSRQATNMIQITMTDDHPLQLPHSLFAQQGQQHISTGIKTVTKERAGIIK